MSRTKARRIAGHLTTKDDPARTPRWMRPKLTRETRQELSLAHHANLDAIASGDASPRVLWDWAGGCLTWSFVAQDLKRGEEQMKEQLDLVQRVISHFEQTGEVRFPTPADYELAVDGVVIMDLLAEATDSYTAGLAANWSEARINSIASHSASMEAHA